MSTINSANTASSGSNSVYKTNSRVTGMFSNLDTDTLVKNMTSRQQAKIDAVKAKQTKQEWYNEALTSVRDDISNFISTYVSQTGSNSMLKTSTYGTYKATTSSTANAVDITASSTSELGDLTIQINQLASNASVTSSTKISKDGTAISANNTAALKDLSLANPLKFGPDGNISFAINGKTFSFSSDTSLQSMINSINNDTTANVTMKYSRLTDSFTITSDSGGADSKVKITNLFGNAFGTNSAFGIGEGSVSSTGASISSQLISAKGVGLKDDTVALGDLALTNKLTFDSSGNLSFSINGKSFTFSKTTSLKGMLDTINKDTDAKVTMFYNSGTDGFTIMSDSGSDASVVIKNLTGNAFGNKSAFGLSEAVIKHGTNSEAVINGATVKRDSNDYTIDGITYNLKKVTKGTSEPTVDFTLEHDYSATVGAVSKFIDAYNTLFNKLKSLNNETDNSSKYPPLTDAQKAEMKPEEITAWEKKAKSGILRHNSDLESLMSDLKNAFYSALGGTSKNATEIGITTAGYFETNAGEIELDESALTKALQANSDEVIRMFTNGSTDAASSQQGLIYKIRKSLTDYTSTVKDSMDTAKDRISKYDTEISDLEDKLGDMADRYYSKFSAMETALSKLNSQSSFISQMFAGNSGG